MQIDAISNFFGGPGTLQVIENGRWNGKIKGSHFKQRKTGDDG